MAKANIEFARVLFLFGDGDGKRVLGVDTLAKRADLHSNTVRRHLPEWEKEFEGIVRTSETGTLAFPLSSETFAAHRTDTEFFRDRCDQLKRELEISDESADDLRDLLERVADSVRFSPEDAGKVLDMLAGFFRMTANRQKLTSQLLAVQKHWQQCAGVAASIDAYGTGAKEHAKRAARQPENPGEAPREAQGRTVTPGGAFRKSRPPGNPD